METGEVNKMIDPKVAKETPAEGVALKEYFVPQKNVSVKAESLDAAIEATKDLPNRE